MQLSENNQKFTALKTNNTCNSCGQKESVGIFDKNSDNQPANEKVIETNNYCSECEKKISYIVEPKLSQKLLDSRPALEIFVQDGNFSEALFCAAVEKFISEQVGLLILYIKSNKTDFYLNEQKENKIECKNSFIENKIDGNFPNLSHYSLIASIRIDNKYEFPYRFNISINNVVMNGEDGGDYILEIMYNMVIKETMHILEILLNMQKNPANFEQ